MQYCNKSSKRLDQTNNKTGEDPDLPIIISFTAKTKQKAKQKLVSELSARLLRGVQSSHYEHKQPAALNKATTTTMLSAMKTTTTTTLPQGNGRNNYGTKLRYSDMPASASATAAGVRSSAVVSPVGGHHNVSNAPDLAMTIAAHTEKLDKISSRSATKTGRSHAIHHHNAASSNNGCFKRRKIDDLQFAASRVQEDLGRAGMSVPKLNTKYLSSHCFGDGVQVDTSGIKLLNSRDVQASPFLATIHSNHEMSVHRMMELNDLFSVTLDSYGKPSDNNKKTVLTNSSAVSASDANSICSLVSAPCSDSSTSVLEQPPRTSSSSKKVHFKMAVSPNNQPDETEAEIYANPISIRDAFDNTHQARYVFSIVCICHRVGLKLACQTSVSSYVSAPHLLPLYRLVTLSFAPFIIVHVNPAYTSLTGLSPSDCLGKPFHDVILQDEDKKTPASSSLANLHNEVKTFASSNKQDALKCRVHSSVVCPETDTPEKCNTVTHFLISLEPEEETMTNTKEEEEDDEDDESSIVITDDETVEASNASSNDSGDDTATSDDDEDAANNDADQFSLALSLLQAPAHTMHHHCGVMG